MTLVACRRERLFIFCLFSNSNSITFRRSEPISRTHSDWTPSCGSDAESDHHEHIDMHGEYSITIFFIALIFELHLLSCFVLDSRCLPPNER